VAPTSSSPPSTPRPGWELVTLEMLGGAAAPAAHDRLDVEALLRRNPEVVVIDELNGLDTEGRLRAESLQRLVEAGITVLVRCTCWTWPAFAKPTRPSSGTVPRFGTGG